MEHATTLRINFFNISELPGLEDPFCIDTNVSLRESTVRSQRCNLFEASNGNFVRLPNGLNSIRQLSRLPSPHALRKGHWTLTMMRGRVRQILVSEVVRRRVEGCLDSEF